jgi:hypothetical protein
MAEPPARVKEIVEKVKSLSPNEQKLLREWLDAWIKLSGIEAKIKQARGGE